MRLCKTISDLLDLLADYNCVLLLTDSNELHIGFIEQHKEKLHICGPNIHCYETIRPIEETFKNETKKTIASLVNSSEFWRKTTVADQLGRFAMSNPDLQIKVRKKANEPLKMVFFDHNKAETFFNLAEKQN